MFQNNLKNFRKTKGLSQEQLACKLNVVRQTVSKWEKGLSTPNSDLLPRIAEVLECSVSALLDEANSETSRFTREKSLDKKSCKRRKSKVAAACLTAIFGLMLGICLYICSRPVSWDAGACSGGYATFVFDKYQEELVQIYLNGSEDPSSITSIRAIRGTQSAQWENQSIFLQFDIEYHHITEGRVVERVRFIGERRWIDTYDWSGALIEI